MTASTEAVLAKTARGAGWVIDWRMATRVLGMISTLILARTPGPGGFRAGGRWSPALCLGA